MLSDNVLQVSISSAYIRENDVNELRNYYSQRFLFPREIEEPFSKEYCRNVFVQYVKSELESKAFLLSVNPSYF